MQNPCKKLQYISDQEHEVPGSHGNSCRTAGRCPLRSAPAHGSAWQRRGSAGGTAPGAPRRGTAPGRLGQSSKLSTDRAPTLLPGYEHLFPPYPAALSISRFIVVQSLPLISFTPPVLKMWRVFFLLTLFTISNRCIPSVFHPRSSLPTRNFLFARKNTKIQESRKLHNMNHSDITSKLLAAETLFPYLTLLK